MANESVVNASVVFNQSRAVDAAMATVYAVICVGGLIGHALVLLVVARDRHQPSRAVSNSYIASLSVADIGFLLGLPFVIATLSARRWLFGISLCKVTPKRRSIFSSASSLHDSHASLTSDVTRNLTLGGLKPNPTNSFTPLPYLPLSLLFPLTFAIPPFPSPPL